MVLVGWDTDRIKNYVFATAKLKEIRGASSILDELNDDVIRDVVGRDRVIYAAGGSALAEIEDVSEAQHLIGEVERLYRRRTKSAEITGDWVEMADANTSFGEYARRLNFKIRLRKDEKLRRRIWLNSPVVKGCQSCGEHPAALVVEESFICVVCNLKRNRSKEIKDGSFGSRLKQLLGHARAKGQWPGLTIANAPDDFEGIGEAASPKGYIGFIYCDGNRIGELFSQLDREPYRKLSNGMGKALREVIFDAFCHHFPNPDQVFPFEIIFIGGDDLVLVVAADKAMEIALDLCREFEKRTKRILEEAGLSAQRENLSLSAAVVLSHQSLPIYHLQAIADDLLKSAKQRSLSIREKENKEVGCIDFHVVTASASELPSLARKAEWVRYKGDAILSLTERPYTTDEMEAFISRIRELQAANFPTSKLQMLYESIVDESMTQSQFTWAFVAGRAKKSKESAKDQFSKLMAFFDPKQAEWKWPWRKAEATRLAISMVDGKKLYATPMVDVAELYEFVKLKK